MSLPIPFRKFLISKLCCWTMGVLEKKVLQCTYFVLRLLKLVTLKICSISMLNLQYLTSLTIYMFQGPSARSKEHILKKNSTAICNSHCETCIDMESVCAECKGQGQSSHRPSLRACQRCLQAGNQCVIVAVMVVTTDSKSGNTKAFELIAESRLLVRH